MANLDWLEAILPGNLFTDLRILFSCLAVVWVLWIVDELVNQSLRQTFTIRPRTDKGLPGVLGAPLFQPNFKAILASSWAFLVMGWFIIVQSFQTFIILTIVVWAVSNLGFWLLAPKEARFFGASGILFGYLGFLLLRGYFERSIGGIILSLFIALAFGSWLLSMLPGEKEVTWQANLLGFIGGILVARHLPELQTWFEDILLYFGVG
jgi:membrane associated rhomboid family serine protease